MKTTKKFAKKFDNTFSRGTRMTFKCPTCGDVEYLVVNGYAFGDTLLEGVMFEIRRTADGKLTATVEDSAKEYFENLNEEKWLKEAVKFVKEENIVTCPKCEDEVEIDISKEAAPKTFKEIPAMSIQQVIDRQLRQLPQWVKPKQKPEWVKPLE